MQLHLKQLADKLRHEKVINKQLSARVQLNSAPIPSYPPDGARGPANPASSGGVGDGGGSHKHPMFRPQHPLGSSSMFHAPRGTFRVAEGSAHKPFF